MIILLMSLKSKSELRLKIIELNQIRLYWGVKLDKIQSLKGMIDLIANRSDQDDFAESIFRTEDALKNIFVNLIINILYYNNILALLIKSYLWG